MRCTLCGRSVPTTPFLVGPNPGRRIGDVCGEECGRLLWDLHFHNLALPGFAPATRDERELTNWRIRRRVAEANGIAFTQEPPKSVAELALETVLETRGLKEVA